MATSSVILLGFSTNPVTVIWRIWPIIVNAVKSHILFWHTHICNKICEGMPSIANNNTSTAIVRPTFAVRVVATLVHTFVAATQSSYRRGPSIYPSALLGAATTCSVARNKMPSNNGTNIPTVADTLPEPSFISPLPNVSDCNQLTKTLPTYINTFSHNYILPPKIRYVNPLSLQHQ